MKFNDYDLCFYPMKRLQGRKAACNKFRYMHPILDHIFHGAETVTILK